MVLSFIFKNTKLLTTLSSVSNLGGTFPRIFVLKLVDFFTIATCIPPTVAPAAGSLKGALVTTAFSCALEPEKNRCTNGGGTCQIERDGYYLTNILCVLIGTVTFVLFIKPAAKKLQSLPLRAWRLNSGPEQK
jgi:hypothetical protein